MFLVPLNSIILFTKETSFQIVSSLRTRREKLLIESSKNRKTPTLRALSIGSTKKKSTTPKFSSPLLEQIFSGMSQELKDVITGKTKKP